MNQKYLDMVQGLADKLGTTAEHLWGVLVTQAPITAAFELFFTLAFSALTVFLGRWVYIKTKTPAVTKNDPHPNADLRGDDAMWAWAGVGILGLICMALVASNGAHIIAGFFNPEYWALMQII